MAGKQPGLESSKWAPPKQQLQIMNRPYMNPNLATTLNLGIVPATPKSKSVPSLGTALDSSSPAGSEAITPLETQERRESFITCNNLRTLTLAAEDLQDDTDFTVVNPPTSSPAKLKENQLPASALPFTLRSSSLPQPPQPSVTDKMAGAKKPSTSTAVHQSEMAGRGPMSIAERLNLIRHRHTVQAGAKNDEKAEQDKAEAARVEADRLVKEKAAVARIEAERAVNEKKEAALREQAQRAGQEKAQAAAKEAEIRGKEKAQAAAKEAERIAKEKAQAAAKEAELRAKEKAQAAAKEAERIGKEKAQAAAKEAERIAKEKEKAARLAQEKAEAARIAKEKAVAAKVDLQKVINTTEVTYKTLETKIDFIKDTYAKHDEEGLAELEQAQLFLEEVKKDQEDNSALMTQKIAEVAEAQAVVDQAQLVVENLREKASGLEDTLAEVSQIVSDKEKNLSDLKKDAQDQLAVFEKQRDEVVKKLEQLVKQFAILETSNHTVGAQKVDGEVDVVAPAVKTKATAEVNGQNGYVNGQANGQVEAQANTNGQVNGKAKLNKPLEEPFNANPTTEERKNVETDGKLTFSAWPQVATDREGLAVRRVKLSNLPSRATLKNVVGLVWGGTIQEFVYTDGQSWAEVLFVDPDDCKRYYDSTPNGIVYPGSKDRHIEVEACPPESARNNVKEILEKGMTRCVRAMDVEADWTKVALGKVAAGKAGKRAVENVLSGLDPKGRRIVDFRFGKIADAIIFKAELHRDMDWEMCPISFGVDPCHTHSGIHHIK